jgi:hypothetical protein
MYNIIAFCEAAYYVGTFCFSRNIDEQCSDWLRAGRPRGRNSSFIFTSHRPSLGSHPAYYPMGTGGFFPGIKRPGREADHSPPASAEVKKM